MMPLEVFKKMELLQKNLILKFFLRENSLNVASVLCLTTPFLGIFYRSTDFLFFISQQFESNIIWFQTASFFENFDSLFFLSKAYTYFFNHYVYE
jgi:hypothetical protein